jgi:hypothetical protein
MLLNISVDETMVEKLAILTPNAAKIEHNILYLQKRQFFTENCRK